MRYLCGEIGIPVSDPTHLGQDNKSAMIIVEEGGTFKQTKHLIGRIGYLRDCVNQGVLTLRFTPTRLMIADMLTKPVPRAVILRHAAAVGIGE